MRTTIEIKDSHRAALLELAGRRGAKGFSSIVGEAIERYLESISEIDRRSKSVLALRGSIRSNDAKDLRERVEAIRQRWR